MKYGLNNKFNSRLKSIVEVKKPQILTLTKIKCTNKINYSLNHPNMVKSILQSQESLSTIQN